MTQEQRRVLYHTHWQVVLLLFFRLVFCQTLSINVQYKPGDERNNRYYSNYRCCKPTTKDTCRCVVLYQTHPSLQAVSLPQCQRVSFGNDWDNVDFAVNGLHELHIQRLKTGKNTEPELVYPAFKHAHIKPLLWIWPKCTALFPDFTSHKRK